MRIHSSRYNEGPRACKIRSLSRGFVISSFFNFHKNYIFYYYWGEENCSLHRGLRYIEVRFIEVPQYLLKLLFGIIPPENM